jgi:uncharacterized protein (TIGR02996 family)
MSPEEAAFLDQVCAAPDDDASRLLYADWLDERSDPRGTFIRVQCALARLPDDDPARPPLLHREGALLDRFEVYWGKSLRGFGSGLRFRRGFIEAINVEARTFLRRAADLFRLAPIRHVRFLDVGSSLERLMDCRHLARLSALTIFAQHIDERLTRSLVESPYLGGLRELELGRNRVGDRGAERLAWSPRFRSLTSLDLSDNAIGDTGARAIAQSSNLANLELLELRRNELSRAGLGFLGGSPALARLRRLGLSLNYVGSPLDMTPPAAGVAAPQSLDLRENGLTEEGIRMLTALPGLGRLSRLDLGQNEIGNGGAAALAAWAGAESLRELLLPNNRIGDDGSRSLAQSPYLSNLTVLKLSDNPVHDPGASEFLNTTRLARLRRLELPTLGLTPAVRRALAQRYS